MQQDKDKNKIICKKCFSNNLRVEKWAYGRKDRLSYFAKFICISCGFRFAFNLKKNHSKELHKITKSINRWHQNGRRPLNVEGLDYVLINNNKQKYGYGRKK